MYREVTIGSSTSATINSTTNINTNITNNSNNDSTNNDSNTKAREFTKGGLVKGGFSNSRVSLVQV